MWRELVSGSEWSELLRLVSPEFFEVLRPRALEREVRALAGNALRRGRWQLTREALNTKLESAGMAVQLRRGKTGGTLSAKERGQTILRLFFFQLYASPSAILDLRFDRFRVGSTTLWWQPRPLTVVWDETFLGALRQLYAGYYGGDDSQFARALSELGLGCAEPVLRAQFAREGQGASAFRVRDFRQSFHEVFSHCHEARATLHGNFVGLGVYLACLYEHLERLGGRHDVAAAFAAALAATGRNP